MTAPTAEQFMTGGGRSVKLERIGETVKGEIIDEPTMMQQRDYETNDLVYYSDGNPAMQMVIRIQTADRDAAEPDDDGIRVLYIKGQLKSALITAMRGCDHKVPRRGGKIAVRLTGLEPVKLKNGKPGNDKKIHEVWYKAPENATAAAFLNAPASAPPMVSAAPVSAAPAALTCPPGIDPAQWELMGPRQQQQMYEALGLTGTQPAGPPPATGSSLFTDEPPF
jgi:hypothetical protein